MGIPPPPHTHNYSAKEFCAFKCTADILYSTSNFTGEKELLNLIYNFNIYIYIEIPAVGSFDAFGMFVSPGIA